MKTTILNLPLHQGWANTNIWCSLLIIWKCSYCVAAAAD